MVTIDVDPHAPLNLAVPDIEAADEGQRERNADAPSPLPDETAATSDGRHVLARPRRGALRGRPSPAMAA